MSLLSNYAFKNGTVHILTHGTDYRGKLCGFDEQVTSQPNLYWCGLGAGSDGLPSSLELRYPICVDKCPTDTSKTMQCLGEESAKVVVSGTAPYITESTVFTRSLNPTKSYPTFELGDFCIPTRSGAQLPGQNSLTASIFDRETGPLGNAWAQFMIAAGGLKRVWWIPLVAGAFAVGFGYLFFLALRLHPAPALTAAVVAVPCGLFVIGLFFAAGQVLKGDALANWKTRNWIFHMYADPDATRISWTVGKWFLLFATLFGLCLPTAKRRITLTADLIVATIELIMEVPSMILQPVVEASVKLVTLGFGTFGLFYLLGTATTVTDVTTLSGVQIGGSSHHLEYSFRTQVALAVYVLGTLWLLNFVNAVSQYVSTYTTIRYYYVPNPKPLGSPTLTAVGLFQAVTFHLGTIAYASFTATFFGPFQLVLGFVAGEAKKEDGMLLCKPLAMLLSSPIGFYQRELEHLGPNALIDVCITSSSFGEAGRNVLAFIDGERANKASELIGALFPIRVIAVTGLAGAIAWGIDMWLTKVPSFCDDTSPNYVYNVYFVVAVSGLVSAAVIDSFMVLVDHVANTLLYIYLWNKGHGHNTVQKYAPLKLVKIVEYTPVQSGFQTKAPGGFLSTFMPA